MRFSVTVTGMSVAVANVIGGNEKVLINTVAGKEDGGSSQTREKSLKPIPSREGSSISPCLTTRWLALVTPNSSSFLRKVILTVEPMGLSLPKQTAGAPQP